MTFSNTISDQALSVEIGRRLTHLRLLAGVRQGDLAARAGISRATLVRLEKGDLGVRTGAFLAVLAQLNRLNGLEVVLPEPGLTPMQRARLEAEGLAEVPKRVRIGTKAKLAKRPHWMDEE